MELGTELGQRRQPGKLFFRQPLRFERPQPDTLHAGDGGTGLHRLCQRAVPLHAVKAQVDAAEDDLPIAVLRKSGGGFPQFLRRQAPAASTGIGDDAVAAKTVAPVLYLQKGTGVVRHGVAGQRLEVILCAVAVHGGDPGMVLTQLRQQSRQPAPVFRAKHQVCLRNGGCLIGIRLGITSRQHQQSIRVFPAHLSHGVAQAAVPGCGDGAGVEEENVRLFRLRDHRIAGALQQRLHPGGLTGVHLASECIKITVQVCAIPPHLQKNDGISEKTTGFPQNLCAVFTGFS